MASIISQGSASGSGSVTLIPPNTNSNQTLTLPDETGTVATQAFVTNRLVQNLNVTTGALATGTTIIPQDDTIPQITEGDQYMTLVITPTSATSILEIDVAVMATYSVAAWLGVALFMNAVAGALGAMTNYNATSTTGGTYAFKHRMVAGTTAEITFRVRIGGHVAGTTSFNGAGGAIRYGGVMASSITIKEYAA